MAKAKAQTLDVKAFGLTCGVLWGGAVLIMGILAMTVGYGTRFIEMLGTIYLGTSTDPVGILMGTVYALLDGGIGGALFAWIYNMLAK